MRLPAGYGSVQKLSGNRRKPYRVRKFDKHDPETGKRIYINLGCYATQKEALQVLADYNNNPWDIKTVNLTFNEVYELSQSTTNKNVSEGYVKNRQSTYKHTAPLHNIPFKDIKTAHLQKVVDESTLGINTKKNLKQVMTKIYNYAVQNDLIKTNYASFVTLDETEESDRKPFTIKEVQDIFKQDDEFYDKVKVLILGGFRIREMLGSNGIKTKNVDLENKIIVTGSKTKAGKNRRIPISKHIFDIIQNNYDPEKEFLFNNKMGNPISYDSFYRAWNKRLKPHVIHDTRHTFASLFDSSGANKLSIKRIIGHASSDVTDSIYTKKSDEDLIEAMALLDKYMDKHL